MDQVPQRFFQRWINQKEGFFSGDFRVTNGTWSCAGVGIVPKPKQSRVMIASYQPWNKSLGEAQGGEILKKSLHMFSIEFGMLVAHF